MSSSALTFLIGIAILALFFWYYSTDKEKSRRKVGLLLLFVITAFSFQEFWPPQQKIALGLDIAGGSSFLLELTPKPGQNITKDMQNSAVEVIRRRIDNLGVSEPVITTVGDNQISVAIPGLEPQMIADARGRLQRVAKLEFRLVHPQSLFMAQRVANGEEVLLGWETKSVKPSEEELKKNPKAEPGLMLVHDKADIEGQDIASAYPQSGGLEGFFVGFKLTGEGKKKFAELTKAHVNEPFAILLDDLVISAPNIKEPITQGEGTISGSFSQKEVEELSSALQNPLQTAVKIVDERSVSPTLGAKSVQSGLVAGLLGLALTFLFVLVYYHLPGLIAIFALIVNLVILLGALAMFHFTLTLPGIAGIVLSIGMAVDANVLIYERLREELAAGKSLKYAIEAAYEKAFSSIFDANATTLITAGILFWLATGPVKGFAVTLTIGIIASMFSALIVTRNCFDWAIALGWLKKISMLNLITSKGIDFLGKRGIALAVSLFLLGGSILVVGIRGQSNLGVDFRGGDLVSFTTKSQVNAEEAKKALHDEFGSNLSVQQEKAGGTEILSVRADFGMGTEIAKKLPAVFPDAGIELQGTQQVGAVVGKQLALSSLLALGLGMLGILAYVTIRFEFSFALGALVALLHDVIITIGAFSLLGGELSLIMVGAILTIAGYSINDTIVVFDRIREGLRAGKRGSIATIMNNSINDTLSRTLLTSGTTLLTVLAMYFLGGPALKDFGFAMFVGIIVGTYSSIFIAAPIVLWWTKFRGSSLRREVTDSDTLVQTPARS